MHGAGTGLASGFRFPDGFLWGAATASHQVEGGNRWNDWWEFEQGGRLPHRSGEACRHYELYEQDFDLARSLGHNAHRLSIEWSRIEPRLGEWNEAACEHYATVLDALRRRGLEPIVTLHHFTNPAWFARRGGWVRGDSVELFARYAGYVATRLASRARFWLTINEPTVYVKRAYVSGNWPPCRSGSWWQASLALRNMCRAHVAAYRVLHRSRSDAMVGFAHSAPCVVACNQGSIADRLAAAARDLALNRTCFLLFGRDPRRVLDFIGLNYYSRQVVRWQFRPGSWGPFGAECMDDHHGRARQFSALGWEIFAPGLREVLRQFSRHGVPLMITENGIATSDEELRSRYLLEHVTAVSKAIQDGVPVLGYLYWTLMDNYEWTEGRTAKFGLAETDFANQQRTPRPAALAFKTVCEANGTEQSYGNGEPSTIARAAGNELR